MVDLWLKDAKIVPENRLVSIGVEEGKITTLKKIAPKREECINLRELIVLPGLIDAHVHFRDPGLTYKEDFRTGTMAAAMGGFTTVIDMPNTRPPTNNPRVFKEKMKIAENKSLVDFALHAGVEKLKDIKGLEKLKPASFKLFMDLLEDSELEEIFKEIKKLNDENHQEKINNQNNQGNINNQEQRKYPIISLHAEDKDTVQKHTHRYQEKKKLNPEIYAKARPSLAETVAVSNALALASKYHLNIHICHLTLQESLKLVNTAKNSGTNVTAEITPHHLLLNTSYLKKCGNLAKTNPPLRDQEDKIKLDNLRDIDIIGTDHAPHTIHEKEQDVWNAPPGIPNLETTLPLLLNLINQRKMTFRDLKRLLCENPARIFKLKNKGYIRPDADADLVVVDMKKEGVINPDKFKSKAKYSPFKGFEVKGMPVMTFSRGNIVMEEGDVFKNQGKSVYS